MLSAPQIIGLHQLSSVRKLIYKVFGHLAQKEIAALESDCKNPREAQWRKLQDILSRNADTVFGVEHKFSAIKSIADFQSSIEVSDYEKYRPYVDRIWAGEDKILTSERPLMFATTSGTMGKSKYIPVTESYLNEFRAASTASGYFMLKAFPGIANGATLSVFSPATEGHSPGGTPYGAISGGLYLREPWLMKKYISPIPYQVYLLKDYESKYYALLRCALALPISSFYTLNPSTIVILLKKLDLHAESLIKDIADGTCSAPGAIDSETISAMSHLLKKDPERARRLSKLLERGEFKPDKIWEELQVVCCWTRASAAFYIKDFPQYFGQLPICDISYGASEGRGSVSMGDGTQLLSIRSHFFEFIREDEIDNANPTVYLADELTVGENYYILFTTSAGLYRYHINDVIKVVGYHHKCPLIEFQYKGGNISSFTGEKLTELQITQAMQSALKETNQRCRFFTVIPEFRPNPHYKLLVEPDDQTLESELNGQLSALLKTFETELCSNNEEYKTKRNSLRLDPPEVAQLPAGAYEKLRSKMSCSGVPDAQIKFSHLNPKEEVRAYFEQEAAMWKRQRNIAQLPASQET